MADPKTTEPTLPVVQPGDDAAAAKAQEILDQTILEALNKARPEQLIGPEYDQELQKGAERSSSAWVHAPAQVELLSLADQRLTRVANANRTAEPNTNLVERVTARLVPGTKLLVLRPASSQDLTAQKVNRYAGQSGAWINLFALLKPAGLCVETGYRELFTVSYVPKTSALWPGLVIDLGRPQDRRQEPKRKKKGEDA